MYRIDVIQLMDRFGNSDMARLEYSSLTAKTRILAVIAYKLLLSTDAETGICALSLSCVSGEMPALYAWGARQIHYKNGKPGPRSKWGVFICNPDDPNKRLFGPALPELCKTLWEAPDLELFGQHDDIHIQKAAEIPGAEPRLPKELEALNKLHLTTQKGYKNVYH